MGTVIPFPTTYEPLMSKRQLADYLGFSTRWVELRVHDGLPVATTIGNQKRFRLSQVEPWVASWRTTS